MTVDTATMAGDGGNSIGGNDRSALEGMLKSYNSEQLVDEVLIAWDELSARNDDLVATKQRLRILELDLAEREDGMLQYAQKNKSVGAAMGFAGVGFASSSRSTSTKAQSFRTTTSSSRTLGFKGPGF